MQPCHFHLVPATRNDVNFIYSLRQQTMKPFFEHTIGWEEKREYQSAGDHIAATKIIVSGSRKIGVVKVLVHDDEIILHQLQIGPQYQQRGIGRAFLVQTIEQADTLQLPITLMVMKKPQHNGCITNTVFELLKISSIM